MNLEFITIKDPHFSFGFMNKIRNNYERDILKKLDFVKGYCSANTINKIFFTGDVFDSSTEDKWSFKKYRKNKRVIESIGVDVGVELYSNVGNHDMFHGFEGSNETIFGEMVHDASLYNITDHPLLIREDNLIIKVQGVDYSVDKNIVLENIRIFDEESYPGMEMYKIAILHSNITPDEVSKITDFTYRNLADTFPDIDMFICGHYHLGYPTLVMEREPDQKSVTFVNNWNFTRVVRDYEVELDEHTPEFDHINVSYDFINQKFVSTCTTVKVPFLSYDETFIAKAIDLLKKSAAEIFSFFKKIKFDEAKLHSKSSDEELIEEFKSNHSFSDAGILKAISYLNEAKD